MSEGKLLHVNLEIWGRAGMGSRKILNFKCSEI